MRYIRNFINNIKFLFTNDLQDIKYLVNDNISLSYIRQSLNNNAKDINELKKKVRYLDKLKKARVSK